MDAITLKNVLSRSIMYEVTPPSTSTGLTSIRICKIPDVGYFKFFLTFKKDKTKEDNTKYLEYSTIEFEISNKRIVRHFSPEFANTTNEYKYLLEIIERSETIGEGENQKEITVYDLYCHYNLTNVKFIDIELEYATNYVDEVYIEDANSFTSSNKSVETDLIQNGIMYFNSSLNLSNNNLNLENLTVKTLKAQTYANSINLGKWKITKTTDNSKIVISLEE